MVDLHQARGERFTPWEFVIQKSDLVILAIVYITYGKVSFNQDR